MIEEIRRERFSHVPERISGLVDLSFNLWWSWNPAAAMLFKQLNTQEWKECDRNPVKALQDIPVGYLERAAKNREYLRRYDIVMHRFRQYMMTTRSSWFSEQYPERRPLTIAYFSSEFGLHHSLPFYAGGLGFLAGDHLKECSDLGVPMVGLGFIYAGGYLHQHIEADGWQKNVEDVFDWEGAPITRVLDDSGSHMVVQVPLIDPALYVRVWKVQVGRIPLYLLDTNVELNMPEYRDTSRRLYLGDIEGRLRQEIALGIGGRKVLNTLGITYSAVHLNEGHSAFALLERMRERVERGMTPEDAMYQVRGTSVFTTHTPVPAGHDVFPLDLIETYFDSYYPSLGLDWEAFTALGRHPDYPDSGFDMTALGFRLSRFHNGVSKKHAEVARRMWQNIWPELPEEQSPIDAITNGVHLPTWLNNKMDLLYSQYIGSSWPSWQDEHDNPDIWSMIDEIPDGELWDIHLWLKMKLFARIRERKRRKWAEYRNEPANVVAEGLMLDTSALTFGFARRICDYKRADLIFHDLDRLERLVTNRWMPVQFVFAGKAHPADRRGKEILQRIYQLAEDPRFAGRIAFLEDYGEQLARYLVQGVDVWLNNPLPLMEASGTSGMKVALNGVLNLSILDGWWLEGYNGRNGWAFEGHPPSPDRDAADANALYEIIEKEVVPLYYARALNGIPHKWVQMMKESIKSIAPRFSTRRMVKEYVTKYYPSVCLYAGEPTDLGEVCPVERLPG
ncbi:MAG: alpha-glucan family phosphorylase [Methanomicrobiaceae archaeon]|nr:alpha-glucan family phosphorylase [Methanomicrobiaceae archaeon]